MIDRLKIERFKSIRLLDMECRRINLFIGEPNVGKSNILEALGLLSWCGSPNVSFKDFVRFQFMQDIFYDCLKDETLRIEFAGELPGEKITELKLSEKARVEQIERGRVVTVKSEKDKFIIGTSDPQSPQIARLDFNGKGLIYGIYKACQVIKFYRFKSSASYKTPDPSALIPPNGVNLFSVLQSSKVLWKRVVDLFEPYGLLAIRKPQTQEVAIQKQEDGIVTEFPFEVMSDTLQRVMFYEAAMLSNKDAILVFEEPEAHAFPYNTKHLGEQLALDETNQYFIATHNPYLLSAVVEKANKNEVGVFITYLENHETKVKMLTGDELGRLLDADPFLSIESFISGEGK